MLFLGGDLIEAGLCPLKLPRYSMVFPAEDRFFDSLFRGRCLTPSSVISYRPERVES